MKTLMKGFDFTIGIALVLMFAGASYADDSKTKHLSCNFAATFVSGVENHLDTNGDGRSASVHQGLANCNIGRFPFQEEFEFRPLACPGELSGWHHGVQYSASPCCSHFRENRRPTVLRMRSGARRSV